MPGRGASERRRERNVASLTADFLPPSGKPGTGESVRHPNPLLSSVGLAGALWLPMSACGPQALPGTSLGYFDVEAQLIENGCGATAIPAFETFGFGVEIRSEAGRAWWIRDQRPFVEGQATGETHLTFRTELPVPTEVTGCVLSQVERIEVDVVPVATADAGTPTSNPDETPGLTGDNTVDIAPAAGANCSLLTANAGGPFLSLPCQLSYELLSP